MRREPRNTYASDALAREQRERRRSFRPSFGLVEGDGLDARARQGVSSGFVAAVKLFCTLAVFFLIIGVVTVRITTSTLELLSESSQIQSDISEAESLNAELKVELAVLSSSSRIVSIATESYGMVLPTDYVHISLTKAEETADVQAEEASSELETLEASVASQLEMVSEETD